MFSKKDDFSILIYIGTGKISVASCVFSKKSTPKILNVIKLPFPISQKIDEVFLTRNMLSLLDNTLESLIKKKDSFLFNRTKNIKSIFVGISSPWYVSKIKDINLSQEKQFIITENFIRNILSVEEQNFKDELEDSDYEKKFDDKAESKKFDLSIIENTLVSSKINGYFIQDYLSKKTNDFSLSIYSSVIPKEIRDGLYHIIYKHTHLDQNKIYLNTFPLISFYSMKEINPEVNNYLFMDISGEITDITLVHDNSINHNISFPSARNFVIRQVAKNFDVSSEIAESILHLYNLKKLEPSMVDKMNVVLDEIGREWNIYFEDALSQLSKNIILPPFLYIYSNEDVYSVYDFFIKDPKFYPSITAKRNFNVSYINKNFFSKCCSSQSLPQNDEHLLSFAIFINKTRFGF